jgi:hypothetical protein
MLHARQGIPEEVHREIWQGVKAAGGTIEDAIDLFETWKRVNDGKPYVPPPKYYLVLGFSDTRCDHCGETILVGTGYVFCPDPKGVLRLECADELGMTYRPSRKWLDAQAAKRS